MTDAVNVPPVIPSADAYVRVSMALSAVGDLLDAPGVPGSEFGVQLRELIVSMELAREQAREQINAALRVETRPSIDAPDTTAPPVLEVVPPAEGSESGYATIAIDPVEQTPAMPGPAVTLMPWRNGYVSRDEARAGVPLVGRARLGAPLLVIRTSDRKLMHRLILVSPGERQESGSLVMADGHGRVPFKLVLNAGELSETAMPGNRGEKLLVGPAPEGWGMAGIDADSASGVIDGQEETGHRQLISAMLRNNNARYDRFAETAAEFTWQYHDYQPSAHPKVAGVLGAGLPVTIIVSSDVKSSPAPEHTVVDILVVSGNGDGRQLFKAFDEGGGEVPAGITEVLGHLRGTTEQSKPTVAIAVPDELQARARELKAHAFVRVMSLRYRNFSVVRFPLPYGEQVKQGSAPVIAGSGAGEWQPEGFGQVPGPFGRRVDGAATEYRERSWQMPVRGKTSEKSGGVGLVGLLNETDERYAKRPCEGRAGARGNPADRNVIDGDGNVYSLLDMGSPLVRLNGSAQPAFNDPDEILYMDDSALMLWTDGDRRELFDSNNANATTMGAWEGVQSGNDDVHVLSDNDPVQTAYVFSRSRGLLGVLTQEQIRDDCQRLLGKGVGESDVIDWISSTLTGGYVLVRMKKTCFLRYELSDLQGSAVVIGARRNGRTYPVKPGHSCGVLGRGMKDKHAKVHWLGALHWDNAVPDVIYRIPNRTLPGGGDNHLSGVSILRPDWLIASVAGNGNVIGVELNDDAYTHGSVSSHQDFPIETCSYTVAPSEHLATEYWGDPQKTGGRYKTASATPNAEGTRIWCTGGRGDRRIWMEEPRG